MTDSQDARKNYRSTDRIAEENEILKIAVAHIDLSVFVYDHGSMTMRFIDDKTPPLGLPRIVEDPTNYIIEHGVVASESIETLQDLFRRNRAGAEKVSATVKAGKSSGRKENHWYNVVLINCFDSSGSIVRVVGTVLNVTDRIVSELKYSKEEQFRLAMMAENRRVYEINVTRDRFMYLESMNDNIDVGTWQPYAETMQKICTTQVYREDWDAFLKVADRNKLLDAFANGKSEFYCEYRVVDSDGNLTWSGSTTHLLLEPVSGEVRGFIYAQDIDAQKRQEILLRHQAERDPLTGVYNRTASERAIEKVLDKSTRKQLHGFLSIDVDDFKTVNDTFGHMQGDLLLTRMAEGFSAILRSDDVLARMGGDEFIVFLANVGSVKRIHSIAERLCRFVHTLRLNEIEDIQFSISAGIAVYPDNGTSFSELYKYSDAALYCAKQSGKNQVSSGF